MNDIKLLNTRAMSKEFGVTRAWMGNLIRHRRFPCHVIERLEGQPFQGSYWYSNEIEWIRDTAMSEEELARRMAENEVKYPFLTMEELAEKYPHLSRQTVSRHIAAIQKDVIRIGTYRCILERDVPDDFGEWHKPGPKGIHNKENDRYLQLVYFPDGPRFTVCNKMGQVCKLVPSLKTKPNPDKIDEYRNAARTQLRLLMNDKKRFNVKAKPDIRGVGDIVWAGSFWVNKSWRKRYEDYTNASDYEEKITVFNI